MLFTAVATLTLELLLLSQACRAVWCSKTLCESITYPTLEIHFIANNRGHYQC